MPDFTYDVQDRATMTPLMTTPSRITRVGIVAKANLRAATSHLSDIADWLTARGVEAVFDPATASLLPATATTSRATRTCST